jgi:hypothetical protein
MLHEVVARMQKAKDLVTIISHHGLVKLIVNRALSQNQITWGDLIEVDRPLQMEPQMEFPLPQPEIEADPIQLAETQT